MCAQPSKFRSLAEFTICSNLEACLLKSRSAGRGGLTAAMAGVTDALELHKWTLQCGNGNGNSTMSSYGNDSTSTKNHGKCNQFWALHLFKGTKAWFAQLNGINVDHDQDAFALCPRCGMGIPAVNHEVCVDLDLASMHNLIDLIVSPRPIEHWTDFPPVWAKAKAKVRLKLELKL